MNPGDYEQVRQLYARYAHLVDHRQYEDWARCLTVDAVFVSTSGQTYAGRDALIRMVTDAGRALGTATQRHIQANIELDLVDHHGTGRCNLLHYITRDGVTTLNGVGLYRDELVLVDRCWLFARRSAAFD